LCLKLLDRNQKLKKKNHKWNKEEEEEEESNILVGKILSLCWVDIVLQEEEGRKEEGKKKREPKGRRKRGNQIVIFSR